jgi:hypothetical protein
MRITTKVMESLRVTLPWRGFGRRRIDDGGADSTLRNCYLSVKSGDPGNGNTNAFAWWQVSKPPYYIGAE